MVRPAAFNFFRRSQIVMLALLAALSATSANAAIYQVTTTADSGTGSMRQALTDANATPSIADDIHFAIPGEGPHVINVLTPLPFVTSTVTIDGFTQPGASPNTLSPTEGGLNTVLRISLLGTGNGLLVFPPTGVILTVQGLNIAGFGIGLRGEPSSGTSQIRSFGNFLCTNITGDAAFTTTTSSVGIRANIPMVVGGELPWQRNLISGCKGSAVVIGGGNADIRGNLIGTDHSGTLGLGNGSNNNWPGLYVINVLATVAIGGTSTSARNLISGNSRSGIGFNRTTGVGAYADIRIFGNYIGTDWRGLAPVPNGFSMSAQAAFGGGIRIFGTGITDTTPLIIGGFLPGQGNLIAFNNGSGISASDNSPGAAFESRGNTIYGHTFGGATNIDLGGFGRTANDVGDSDTGVNDGQNYPEILSVPDMDGVATVRYRVDTLAANATYPLRIDFYRGRGDGSSGQLLAQDIYPAASATQVREFSFTPPPGEFGMPITAIASNANRSSELAPVLDILFDSGFE